MLKRIRVKLHEELKMHNLKMFNFSFKKLITSSHFVCFAVLSKTNA